jgi:hypothetical protein
MKRRHAILRKLCFFFQKHYPDIAFTRSFKYTDKLE